MATSSCTEFQFLRQGARMTVEEAADYLEISARQVRRYDNGESKPPPSTIRILRMEAAMLPVAKIRRKPKFTFIDLFAGIGGLRLGFEKIGGECIFTSEWDKYSQATYRANFTQSDTHIFAGDIRPFGDDPSMVPAHDVLLAGFPCQPFSIAGVSKKNALGRPHGFKDKTQGTLFFDIKQIIGHHRPAAFLLENVKNLQRHDKGKTFQIIREALENDLGYTIDFRVVSSSPWVPQKRERIFIVGFRDDVGFGFDGFEKMLPPQSAWPVLGDILQGHNEVDSKYTLTPRLWEYLQDYRKKHEALGNGFGFGLCQPGDIARTLSARYYKDGSEILIAQCNKRPRRLTPTECARLMGFEHGSRTWNIPVSDTQAYKQFGNSVVVPMVEAIADYMKPSLYKALRSERSMIRPRKAS